MNYKDCLNEESKLWSEEYPLREDFLDEVPSEPGIYIICLPEKSGYRWIKENNKWYLEQQSWKIRLLIKQIISRNVNIKQPLLTRLVYIGESENLKERIRQHIKNQTNDCIRKILSITELTFRFRKTKNHKDAEKEAYKAFCKETGLCPPCDCNSVQCKSVINEGKYPWDILNCKEGKAFINNAEACP